MDDIAVTVCVVVPEIWILLYPPTPAVLVFNCSVVNGVV